MNSARLGETMASQSLSTRLVAPALVWRRVHRQGIRLWNRHLLRYFLPNGYVQRYQIQLILLLVIIPSILAGVVIAQASGQVQMSGSLFHR